MDTPSSTQPAPATPAPQEQPKPATASAPATPAASASPTATQAPAAGSATATPAPKEKPVSTVPQDERMLAAVGYIPMLFVGPLIMKPKSAFCQAHGKQAMILTLLTFLVLMMLAVIPIVGVFLFLADMGLVAVGAFQAYSGMDWKIPVLGNFAGKIDANMLMGTPAKPKVAPSATPAQPAPPATPAISEKLKT